MFCLLKPHIKLKPNIITFSTFRVCQIGIAVEGYINA